VVTCNGVGTNFGVGVGEARPVGPRARDEVLGEGAASPSPPARGFAGRPPKDFLVFCDVKLPFPASQCMRVVYNLHG